jgi:hypothetical protein
MNERWNWLARYAVVIVVALVLAAALGSTALFNKTHLIGKGLSASHLVRFLGFGGALAVLWLAAYRATGLLHEQGERWRIVESLLLPLATLIVVASAHPVMLLIVQPLMDKSLRQIFDWVFISGIVASAGWLLLCMFNGTGSVKPAGNAATVRREPGEPTPSRI